MEVKETTKELQDLVSSGGGQMEAKDGDEGQIEAEDGDEGQIKAEDDG